MEKQVDEKKAYFTEEELLSSRVRVYGKAQNRTALGIVNAYFIQYPNASFEDFEKAFPKELNPDSGWPVNFKKYEDLTTKNEKSFFFTSKDEILKLNDGTKMVVCKMWTKPSFERIVNHAKQYKIVVADFEESKKVGVKGSYRLEYLNGWVPAKTNKKKSFAWLWFLPIILLMGAVIAWLLNRPKEVVEKVVNVETVVHDTLNVEKIVEVHDTLYIEQLKQIEKNFNAAEFVVGKSELSTEAKFVLHDLGKLMKENPELRLRISGHTSLEGNAKRNQRLSEARAQAAVTFLIEHEGIEAERLEAAGFGSSNLKNTENPMAPENRRTEFEVIE